MGQYVFGLPSDIKAGTLWLGFNLCCVDLLTPVVMAVIGLKRFLFSNTSCFSNIYLVECLRKYKSKNYLNSLLMTIRKNLSLAKKKLVCLIMKMCKGIRLRRVKVKGLARKRQMRKSPFPLICHLNMKCVLWWSLHLKWWTCVCGTWTVAALDTWRRLISLQGFWV